MTFLAVIGFICVSIATSIFNGYALSVLWGWFMVPTFGLPELNIAPAIGISMVVSYLTYQRIAEEKKDEGSFKTKVAKMIGNAIGKPLFALFFGWVVQLFM